MMWKNLLKYLIVLFSIILTSTSSYAQSIDGEKFGFNFVNIILIGALLVIFIPYIIPIIISRIKGMYISDWDNNLGSCFGGSLGGGFGMFSGIHKGLGGGKW